MFNRLIEPTSGKIFIDGKNILSIDPVVLRRSIGYVFQGIGLFPHMTVAENIAIVLRLSGKNKTDQLQRARELLTMINLDPDQYANRLPAELSGGQQQRVGVARALASDPQYLLMDEPFGALDALTRDALQTELIHLKKQLKKTIVFVTHDIHEALRIGDRIAVMNRGRIEQIGDKKTIVRHPKTKFVRDLFQLHGNQLEKYLNKFEG
jgi:osmoprotectant transport system ATP-binding protein